VEQVVQVEGGEAAAFGVGPLKGQGGPMIGGQGGPVGGPMIAGQGGPMMGGQFGGCRGVPCNGQEDGPDDTPETDGGEFGPIGGRGQVPPTGTFPRFTPAPRAARPSNV